MELDKDEWKVINKAIDQWADDGTVSKEQADNLRKSIHQKENNNQQIAQYFFLIALSCMLLAFGAIFIDYKVLERFRVYFSLSNIVIAILAVGISALWFWYVRKKKMGLSWTAYEIYMVVGALAALISLTYICKETGFGGKYSGYLAVAAVLLFTLSIFFRARFLWIAGILAAMGFYGTITSLYSVQDRFLGMNYPIRFTIFGLLILLVAWLQKKKEVFKDAGHITYIAGMVIFFTGLWGVSIFGNYSDMAAWSAVRQVQVIAYGILFAIVAGVSFFYGIKYKDDVARDFGILFLLVNLYSRYFEFFWDNMNKGIFFVVLAVSFYGVGRWLEKRKKVSV